MASARRSDRVPSKRAVPSQEVAPPEDMAPVTRWWLENLAKVGRRRPVTDTQAELLRLLEEHTPNGLRPVEGDYKEQRAKIVNKTGSTEDIPWKKTPEYNTYKEQQARIFTLLTSKQGPPSTQEWRALIDQTERAAFARIALDPEHKNHVYALAILAHNRRRAKINYEVPKPAEKPVFVFL